MLISRTIREGLPNVRDNWDRLSPATQQWLRDIPGCLILPRTMTALEDVPFIQAKANKTPTPESGTPVP